MSDLVNRLCGIANEERHNQHVNGISFVCDQAADRIAELEATIKRVEDAVASHEEGLGDMVVAEIALALAGEAK